jgi:hypothetical protein
LRTYKMRWLMAFEFETDEDQIKEEEILETLDED